MKKNCIFLCLTLFNILYGYKPGDVKYQPTEVATAILTGKIPVNKQMALQYHPDKAQPFVLLKDVFETIYKFLDPALKYKKQQKDPRSVYDNVAGLVVKDFYDLMINPNTTKNDLLKFRTTLFLSKDLDNEDVQKIKNVIKAKMANQLSFPLPLQIAFDSNNLDNVLQQSQEDIFTLLASEDIRREYLDKFKILISNLPKIDPITIQNARSDLNAIKSSPLFKDIAVQEGPYASNIVSQKLLDGSLSFDNQTIEKYNPENVQDPMATRMFTEISHFLKFAKDYKTENISNLKWALLGLPIKDFFELMTSENQFNQDLLIKFKNNLESFDGDDRLDDIQKMDAALDNKILAAQKKYEPQLPQKISDAFKNQNIIDLPYFLSVDPYQFFVSKRFNALFMQELQRLLPLLYARMSPLAKTAQDLYTSLLNADHFRLPAEWRAAAPPTPTPPKEPTPAPTPPAPVSLDEIYNDLNNLVEYLRKMKSLLS